MYQSSVTLRKVTHKIKHFLFKFDAVLNSITLYAKEYYLKKLTWTWFIGDLPSTNRHILKPHIQIPVIQLLLGQVGLVSSEQMLSVWRYVVVGAVVAAAVLTPSTDPLTQVLLAGPLVGLYLGGASVVKLMGRWSIFRWSNLFRSDSSIECVRFETTIICINFHPEK